MRIQYVRLPRSSAIDFRLGTRCQPSLQELSGMLMGATISSVGFQGDQGDTFMIGLRGGSLASITFTAYGAIPRILLQQR